MKKLNTILLFILGMTWSLSAQMGDSPYEKVYVLNNSVYEYTLQANLPTITKNPEVGDADRVNVGGNNWDFTYDPEGGLGISTVILEIISGNIPNITTTFKAWEFHSVESVIFPTKDYKAVFVNDVDVILDVLSNDSTSAGALNLTVVPLVDNGTAFINQNNEIVFTPTPGFGGMAYLSYVACDSYGTCATGEVTICVLEPGLQLVDDSVHVITSKNTEVSILLPSGLYEEEDAPQNGILEELSPDVYSYIPNQGFYGTDTFSLATNDVERMVYMKVIYTEDIGTFTVDDYFHTTPGNTVVFDVFDNDLTDNFNPDFTQPPHGVLTHLGDGEFSFLADSNFVGKTHFDYTVCDLFQNNCETARVTIKVDEFKPLNETNYNFTTTKNVPLIIEYNIPVESFSFDVLEDPDDGFLGYYDGNQSIYIECTVVSGYNQIVYEPNYNFTGSDAFSIEYCVDGADSCYEVKVGIEVLDIDQDTTCGCVDDCVWPGDANADGQVNITDLLPLGWFMGVSGDARNETMNSEWYGLHSDEWGMNQYSHNADIKHVDTDGDGLVSSFDTSEIIEHYSAVHSFIPEESNPVKGFDVVLEVENGDVEIGDWARIFISVGSENYPLVEYHGLTFSIDYNEEVVEEGSLSMTFADDSWLANDAPCLDMSIIPFLGRIDGGMTRTDAHAASGHGVVAQLDFIVEEDIEGFGANQNLIPMTFTIHGIKAQMGDGSIVDAPDRTITVYIERPERNEEPVVEILENKDFILFPNPAKNMVNLHLNGSLNMDRVTLTDISGRVLKNIELNADRYVLETSDLSPGLYLVEIQAGDQRLIKKLEILK